VSGSDCMEYELLDMISELEADGPELEEKEASRSMTGYMICACISMSGPQWQSRQLPTR